MKLFIIQLKKLFILQKNILIKTIKYSQYRDSFSKLAYISCRPNNSVRTETSGQSICWETTYNYEGCSSR